MENSSSTGGSLNQCGSPFAQRQITLWHALKRLEGMKSYAELHSGNLKSESPNGQR